MAKRLLTWIGKVALVAMAACQPNAVDPNAPAAVDPRNPVEWDRNPSTVVFRADVVGGNGDPFLERNAMPPCTAYGDNHIVWVNELGPFETQVLEDRVTDDQLRTFINYVAIDQGFYSMNERQDNEPASAVNPVVEVLTLFVNNINYQTDAFAGWPVDYYARLLKACKDISVAPVIYEPTAAHVSAQVAVYDPTSPSILWDAQANGLSLAELAASGERRWITDRNVRVIWNILRTSPPGVMFNEGDMQYNVALEIPNVTRNSPPAPG
jgi:hypothetical protein